MRRVGEASRARESASAYDGTAAAHTDARDAIERDMSASAAMVDTGVQKAKVGARASARVARERVKLARRVRVSAID